MLALIAQSPNIAIDESEAENLAKAIQKVTRHYDVPQMAQTTVDWIMLMQTCGGIYGPRLVAWKLDRASRAAKPVPQHRNAPANVAPAAHAPSRASTILNNDDNNPFATRKQPMPSANDPSALDGVTIAQEPVATAAPGRNQPMPPQDAGAVMPSPPNMPMTGPGQPRFNPAMAGLDGANLKLDIK